jgi:arginine/lysine/ornithine decarboxylase
MNPGHIRQTINLTQTTSGSYLLMSSLDVSRRNLALRGKEIFARVLELSEYARHEINKIGGFYAFSKELCDGGAVFDFDRTKLSVYTRDIGLAGIEVYDILRDDYGIQIEFGDIANILAVISVGDTELAIERLVSAMSEIKRLYSRDKSGMLDTEYIRPRVELLPKHAFYGGKEPVNLETCAGRICAEFVMSYPPGIPILEIVDYIKYAREKGCFLTGTQDITVNTILTVKDR